MSDSNGYQLGPQQRRLWSVRARSGTPVAQLVARLEGRVDEDRLAAAAQTVAARHATLNARFGRVSGLRFPLQAAGDIGSVDWRIERRESLTPEDDEQAVARVGEQERRGVDLETGPTTRIVLLTGDVAIPRLIVTAAAMCADAASLANLLSEIVASYSSEQPVALPEPVSYVQYAEWRREVALDGGALAGGVHTGDAPVALPFARPASAGEFRAGCVGVPLDSVLTANIRRIAGEDAGSLSSFLLTSWTTLISRLVDSAEVPVAVWLDGRTDDTLADAVGPFRQLVPLRIAADESVAFSHARTAVADRLYDAEQSQDLFAGTVSPGLQFEFRERRQGRESTAVGIHIERLADAVEPLVMGLFVERVADRLEAEIRFDSAACDADDVRQVAGQLAALVASAVLRSTAPVRTLSALDSADRARAIAAARTAPVVDPCGACVHELFEAVAARQSQRAALVFSGVETSYDTLNRKANRLARYLRARGVGVEDAVAVSLERSELAIAVLLAVLKAGAVYVPIDPSQPSPRALQMIAEAGATLVIATARSVTTLAGAGVPVAAVDADRDAIELLDDRNLGVTVAPESLAYVVFTSGSTGVPKGVAVEHRQIACYAGSVSHALALSPEATYACVSTLSADLGYTMVFPALCRGGTLILFSEEESLDALAAVAAGARRPDYVKIAPSHLAGWLSSPTGAQLLPASRLILGGEPLTAALVEQVRRTGSSSRIFNHYGPTETTVGVLTHESTEVTADRDVRLGRPMPGAAVYVLDRDGEPVPAWHVGEVFVGGSPVSRGYVRRPAATADRYMPDPFDERGGRLYRTGDRARRHSDGTLEWAGRTDDQIKLRGYRIEPAEIAAAAAKFHMVSAAVVTVRRENGAEPRLVCYAAPLRRYAASIGGGRFVLPNGLAVVHRNKNETEYLYQEIFTHQTYFRHGIRVPEHGRVFDVGANIGMFTMFVAQHAPNTRIYSFEPIPEVATALRQNAEFYAPNAKVFECGISDRAREEIFDFFPRHTMMSGLHAYSAPVEEIEVVKTYMRNVERHGDRQMEALLGNADELLDGRFRTEPVACRLRSLSEVIDEEGIDRIDLLKIDVQRAELEVLRGIAEAHWPLIQQITMELHDAPGKPTEGRVRTILSTLEARGFAATAEQDELLAGTDRWSLYAVRRAVPAVAGPTAPFPTLSTEPAMLTAALLRGHLAAHLPEYMLPSACVVLDELPLKANGKVDRDALPPPESIGAERGPARIAPETPTEQIVAAVWAELLKVDEVGIDDNFFDLGGHSLLVMLVTSRLREIFRVEFPIREFFEAPTVRGLAAMVDQLQGASIEPADSRIVRRTTTIEEQLSALAEPNAEPVPDPVRARS